MQNSGKEEEIVYFSKITDEEMELLTKQKQTHRYGEQISGYQWGEGSWEGQDRGRGLRGTQNYV